MRYIAVPIVDERLESWKEIAAYLKRDVSTVQRWEKREGMPVHRHLHDKLGSVYAFQSELDQWSRSRQLGERAPAVPQSRARFLWPVVGILAMAIVAAIWLVIRAHSSERNPFANARFTRLTDFEGTEQAAAISRDGKFVAFLADRDGPVDVWLTKVGSGQFHNLTHGALRELVNPDVRTIGFSPDGTLVNMWERRQNGSSSPDIDVWAVPILGGEPSLYLKGAAELAWSGDGSRVVYHTPAAGDPTFIKDQSDRPRHVFTAPPGLHAHFPTWSPDDAFIYFVYGRVPKEMDIWRIPASGGIAERMTSHKTRITFPVFVDRTTLLYLATDANGDGPWIHALDVQRRSTRRISVGAQRYTSLAASVDGRRLVVTAATSNRTLWRIPITDKAVDESAASHVIGPTNGGRSPRIGPGYLIYVSWTGDHDTIWKLANGSATQLWTARGARIIGGPAIAPDGRQIAFSAEEPGGRRMYVMRDDGSGVRILPQPPAADGTPAWSPDGRSIAVASTINGTSKLVKVSLDGHSFVPLEPAFAADPAWSPDGASVVYSGPDIGTTFRLAAVSADGRSQPVPNITLTRGARRIAFLARQRALIVLRGDMYHQNFSLVDLATAVERPLTNFRRGFAIRDFDVSADGHEIVFEREQVNSDIVIIDR